MCVLIFSTTFVRNISHSKKNSTTQIYKCLCVNYPLLLLDFNQTWIFLDIYPKKLLKIKFRENPSTGSRVVPYGCKDRQT